MKHIILFVLALFLVGCQSPVSVANDNPGKGPVVSTPGSDPVKVVKTAIIKDSFWNTIQVPSSSMRSAFTMEDAEAIAKAHNESTTESKYFVYEGDAPTIENAPLATVFFCNPENNNPNMVCLDIPRQSLVDNWEAWKAEGRGQAVYVDQIPPPPILDKNVNPYAYYAITMKDDDTGEILYVEHCGFSPDQSWSSELFTWEELESYYYLRLNGFNLMAQSPVEDVNGVMHPNCSVVTRTLYFPPGITQ